MLITKGLTKIYHTAQAEVVGIQDVNIELPDKGLVFIMGKSGSGKTTLMNMLAGLDDQTAGSIVMNGQELTDFNEKQWDDFRNRHLGIIFQSFNLFEDLNVYDNLVMPLKILNIEETRYEEEVERVLAYVDLEGYEKRKISELSTGQKQRISIARAIIKRPDVILADEVTGNLDPENTKATFELLNRISRECLVIVITHDPVAAYKYGDQVVRLLDGSVQSDCDNKLVKEVSIRKYEVSLYDVANQTTQADRIFLDEFDIRKEVIKSIEKKPDLEEVNLNLKVNLQKEEQEEKTIPWDHNYEIRHLQFKEIMKFALGNLQKRKFRLFVTFILFWCTCTLFLVSNMVFQNDYIKAVTNYMTDKKIHNMTVSQRMLHTDETGTTTIQELHNGEKFREQLYEVFQPEELIPCIKEFDLTYYGEEDIMRSADVDAVVMNGNPLFDNLEIEGRLPKTEREVVLDTETFFKLTRMEEYKKTTVMVEEEEFQVVGILKSEIIQNAQYAILSEAYIQDKIDRKIPLCCYADNILESFAAKRFASSCTSLGAWSWLKQSKGALVYGTYPKKENEILISSDIAEQIGWGEKKDLVVDYRLPNLHSDKYGVLYDDKINLYDYFGKWVKVTGIYDSKYLDYSDQEEAAYSKILVSDKLLKDAKTDYYKKYYWGEYIVCFDSHNVYSTVKKLADKNYRVQDKVSQYIYMFMDFTRNIEGAMRIAVIISAVMTIFMMISYIVYNVKDHGKKIGILRSLGVGARDISLMFLVETFIISIITLSVSLFCSSVVVKMINEKLNVITETEGFRTLIMNYSLILVLCIGIIAVSVIMTMLPVISLMRKESITLIKEGNENN